MFQTIKTATALAITLTLSSQALAFDQHRPPVNSSDNENIRTASFEIKIENLTQGQTLTPPLIVIGNEVVFKVGQPSSRALSFLAEDGVLQDFEDSGNFENALFPKKGIAPGEIQKYVINAEFSNSNKLEHFNFSIASMLASTNDAFVGLDRELLRGGFGTPFFVGAKDSFFMKVYDAGTERNTESCRDIPGPPCGSHNSRVVSGAEGVVSVHPGLKLNRGDLDRGLSHSALFPIFGAKVTITRTK